MTPPTLRTRLTLWFAASVLLILSPFLAGILLLQWRSLYEALDHHLQEDLEVALEMLVVGEGPIVWRTDAEQDLGYDAGPRRWVEVYDQDGRPRYFRGLPEREEIRTALVPPGDGDAGYRTVATPAGAPVRTLVARRALGAEHIRIRVARSEDELRDELWQLGLLFGLAAPLAVVAAAAAGHFISGRALAPLGRMADRARSISAEHLSERLPVENPSDELGQLAVVFNESFARLEDSFERLKRFTSDASHELRTPLTAIRSVGEVGLREARTPGEYQEIVGSMLEEADRLSHMVETLLTLSRWESGRVLPQPESIDLQVLARDVADQLEVLAEDRGLTVTVRVPDGLVVAADPVMTRQALTNVLDNAIKFAPQRGHVWVRGEWTSDETRLVVEDDGPGIPEEQRLRVLERFYRADPGLTRGAGLGLAIVDWAVRAHGGHVTLGASAAGGTRVVLAWPRTRS